MLGWLGGGVELASAVDDEADDCWAAVGELGVALQEADLVAVQGAGAEVDNCSPMYSSVRGHEQKPLAEGANVIAIVSQTLGVGLLAG